MKAEKNYRVVVWTKTGTVDAGQYRATSQSAAIAEAKADSSAEARWAQKTAKSERGRWRARAV